ncbi:hypothetical protein F0L68_37255 [Solihabitans fulvus]|uniref:Uncharacterized protein n=1 Tax=Solihabitans fulvus TaxID=1892852 RepID=A0A5B2WKH1_9PSEU|nr:hypothetical protein [Solihabitans fulvus]KAA2251414.1 hypothetical protein F0L68_37255 [Solihabitans fulvus]
MLVERDLAGMHGQPQPDPLLRWAGQTMSTHRPSQCDRHDLLERRLADIWGNQNEHRVAAVLRVTPIPGHLDRLERLPHDAVHAVADHTLMRQRPPRITEPLNIHHDDPAVLGHP